MIGSLGFTVTETARAYEPVVADPFMALEPEGQDRAPAQPARRPSAGDVRVVATRVGSP
jgi:hypothetical protein